MKEIIFVDSSGFKRLNEIEKENCILIDYPSLDNSDLKIKDIDKFNIEEFFPKKLFKNIEEDAKSMHDKFYIISSGKFLYKGLDLFELVKNPLMLHLVLTIKYIKIFDHIIKERKPENIKIIVKTDFATKEALVYDNNLMLRSLLKVCKDNKVKASIMSLNSKNKKNYNKSLKKFLFNTIAKIQNLYFKIKVKNNSKVVLFVGGKNAYLPVLKYLKNKIIRVRCGTTLSNSFSKKDQDYYITFNEDNNKTRFSKNKLNKEILESTLKYKNYDIFEIIKPNLNYIVKSYFNSICEWIDLAYKIEPKIKMAVLTNDTLPFEELLINILQKNSKKCFVVQHAFTTAPEGQFAMVKEKMIADKMFVWGKSSKDWMVKNGVNKNKLVLIGSIKFDAYQKVDFDIKDNYNIPKNKKVVVYVAEGSHKFLFPEYAILEKERVDIYRNLYNTLKEMKDYFLIVKLHPSDPDPKTPARIAGECGIKNCLIIEGSFPIQPLLKISDLVISIYSSAILEAIFFKKPVLIMDYFNKVDYIVPFLKYKMCLGIKDKSKLKSGIINLEKSKEDYIKNNEKILNKFIFRDDGKNYLRISNEILKEIN